MNFKSLLNRFARKPKAKIPHNCKVVGAGTGLFTKEGEHTITGLRYDSFDGMVNIKVEHTGGSKTPLIFNFTVEHLIDCGFINPEKFPIK